MTAPTQHPTSALLRAKQARSYIAAHPGCTALRVGEAVEGVKADHLWFLLRRGYITAKERGGGVCYWVKELE